MFARVNEFEGTAEELAADVKNAGGISRKVDATPGSLGMLYLLDRENGRALAITLWESETAMRDSDERASEIREESSRAAGTRVVRVGRYEVVADTVRAKVIR
jgi:glucose dehydrogenase